MYKQHFFICTNVKETGQSCGTHDTKTICKNLKQKFKDEGHDDIRINQAGCLGQCSKGPVMVVYPQGDWYSFFDQSDVEEIVNTYLSENLDENIENNLDENKISHKEKLAHLLLENQN